jgi:hypothetical protein
MSEKLRSRGSGRIFLRGHVAWIQYYSHGSQIRESTGIKVVTDADRKKSRRSYARKSARSKLGLLGTLAAFDMTIFVKATSPTIVRMAENHSGTTKPALLISTR